MIAVNHVPPERRAAAYAYAAAAKARNTIAACESCDCDQCKHERGLPAVLNILEAHRRRQ